MLVCEHRQWGLRKVVSFFIRQAWFNCIKQVRLFLKFAWRDYSTLHKDRLEFRFVPLLEETCMNSVQSASKGYLFSKFGLDLNLSLSCFTYTSVQLDSALAYEFCSQVLFSSTECSSDRVLKQCFALFVYLTSTFLPASLLADALLSTPNSTL